MNNWYFVLYAFKYCAKNQFCGKLQEAVYNKDWFSTF